MNSSIKYKKCWNIQIHLTCFTDEETKNLEDSTLEELEDRAGSRSWFSCFLIQNSKISQLYMHLFDVWVPIYKTVIDTFSKKRKLVCGYLCPVCWAMLAMGSTVLTVREDHQIMHSMWKHPWPLSTGVICPSHGSAE